MSKTMKKERQRLKQVAKEYLDKGYNVVEDPSQDLLPDSLKTYSPDLLAWNDKEHVIFEFRNQKTLEAENYLKELAANVDQHHGWRFELVVVAPTQHMRGLQDAETLLPKDIRQFLSSARLLLQQDFLPSAHLLAWTALEAAFRSIAEKHAIKIDRPGPDYLIKTLYSAGLVTDDELNFLQKSIKVRNRLAHGFESLHIPRSDVEMLLNIIERKLMQPNLQDESL